jgi:hypothetical protein
VLSGSRACRDPLSVCRLLARITLLHPDTFVQKGINSIELRPVDKVISEAKAVTDGSPSKNPPAR